MKAVIDLLKIKRNPYGYLIDKARKDIDTKGKIDNQSLLRKLGLPDGTIAAFGQVNNGLLIKVQQGDNTNFYMLKNGHLATINFINVSCDAYRSVRSWKTRVVDYHGRPKTTGEYVDERVQCGYVGKDNKGNLIRRDKKTLCLMITFDNKKILESDFPLPTNYSDVRKKN